MKQILEASLETLSAIVRDEALLRRIQDVVDCVREALKRGNKILLCGNGGSAAEAQHIAAEFVGRFRKERKGLPAISLATDTSILTALANDYSFEKIFARQVEALGSPGDVLIALSTSGNSPNCLSACETAAKKNMRTIAFTGAGGKLKDLADISFCVPSQTTAHIQEAHLAVLHTVCDLVEKAFS